MVSYGRCGVRDWTRPESHVPDCCGLPSQLRSVTSVPLAFSPMDSSEQEGSVKADAFFRYLIIAIEYAIVASLIVLAAIVLVRTMGSFLRYGHDFPAAVVSAIDGILVVIIVLDIAHTVFGHLRSSLFPIRPFLVIGILAGVRDILSASAHLTLSGPLSQRDFSDTLISLGVGVGVVVFLLLGLLILRFSGHEDE
jgi:uncharacterized membrane protein (DUF373 family)